MSIYNLLLVLALFLTQFFVVEAYAQKQNQKQIEYIKELRELAEATEKTQNAFFGSELYVSKNNLMNPFLQHLLVNSAWAVGATSQNTCIIAGNIGVLNGGRCSFTQEEKARNATCGVGKVACNPSLYGDNVCISFVSRDDRANATAHCNERDTNYSNVLAKYNKDNVTDALKKIEEEANNIFSHCIKARKSKKITIDQERTCGALESRIAKVGAKACEAVESEQAASDKSDPLIEARIKSCKEIAKASCDSKASQLEKAAENLNKACAANGFKTGQLVSPACYPEVEKCEKNGYSDKCFSSNEALDIKNIEDDVAKLRSELNGLLGSSSAAVSSCFPSVEPKLNGSSKQEDLDNKILYDNYKKFLALKSYEYKGDSQLRSGLASSRNNVEDQRKYWQMYLGRVSAENERVIRAIEKRMATCKLSDSQRAEALDQLSALRAYNDQMANKFRHNQEIVAKTKDNQPGMVDTNDILIKNKREIENWFNSNAKSGTFKACCVSPGKNEGAYLQKNKWCERTGSSISSRVYGVPAVMSAGSEEGVGSGSQSTSEPGDPVGTSN